MKPEILSWDDPLSMHRCYAVKLPLRFLMVTDRLGLTWLMLKLIWGIGATKKAALAPEEPKK